MAGNTAEALRRIHENKRTKSKILDLSGLGLTELPDELWDCVWVEELGLGYWHSWDKERQNWQFGTTYDKTENQLTNISQAIIKLENLNTLQLDNNPIEDLSVLSNLSSLTKLNLHRTKVNDLGALSSLVNLSSLDVGYTDVDDLCALSSLVGLSHLDLSGTKLQDLSALSSLVNLRHLSLWKTSISDLRVLSDLVGLNNLNLGQTEISDMNVLSHLVNLTDLELISSHFSDLNVLSNLPNLEHLNLKGVYVDDFNVLNSLPNLTQLDLSFTKINDLSVLSGLLKLKYLALNSTPIYDLCALSNLINLEGLDLVGTHIDDLSALSGLVNLTRLNIDSTWISNISALEGLVNLKNLYLRNTKVRNLTPLSNLLNLSTLDLVKTSVSDISTLCTLVNLKSLLLKETDIDNFPFDLLFLPKLEVLNIQFTSCTNIPDELTYESNALTHLKNYYADLLKNTYSAYDAKQIIVGNGRVGKTSLLKALYGLGDYNPDEDSTHGIQLFDTYLPLTEKQATVNLSVWDFGGQELYHATHLIFMKTRALYLVIWDPETEAKLGEEMLNLNGQNYIFRNYPLSYWLGNIRAQSRDAKIIVICNKVDNGRQSFPDNLKALQAKYHIDSFISVSAKTGYGILALRQQIQLLLEQMPGMGMQMPGSWRRVKDKLSTVRNQQQYITLEDYYLVCHEAAVSIPSMDTILSFLNLSGFLFWHAKYLPDQIILDQKWALEAIYQLLDRNGWYPLLKGNALRKSSELAKCWSAYSSSQVDLFLEIMQSCDLALRLEDGESDNTRYLIPEFLLDTAAPAVSDIWEANTNPIYHFRYQYPFFHASLIQSFIVHSAKLAERYDLLWRSGLLLKVDSTMALVQVYPETGRIDMQLRGDNLANLLERLKNEINMVQGAKGEIGFLLSLTGRDDEWVYLGQLKQQAIKGKTQIASTTGEILDLAPFQPLLSTSLPKVDEREGKTPGLKELSDKTSGKQLLVPIAPSSPLEALKNQVKSKLIDGIPAAITLLRQHIATNTSTLDNLILIHGQYQRYHEDLTLYDVLSAEERRIGYNKIQKAILELVNSLEEGHLKVTG